MNVIVTFRDDSKWLPVTIKAESCGIRAGDLFVVETADRLYAWPIAVVHGWVEEPA